MTSVSTYIDFSTLFNFFFIPKYNIFNINFDFGFILTEFCIEVKNNINYDGSTLCRKKPHKCFPIPVVSKGMLAFLCLYIYLSLSIMCFFNTFCSPYICLFSQIIDY